jgi:phosphoglycerate kinase
LRFHIEEEKRVRLDDGTKEEATKEGLQKFVSALSRLGNVYVNDAFGTMHRAHTSITDIAISKKLGGLLVKKELQAIGPLLTPNAPRIELLVLGGAKVADKIKLIEHLIPRTRKIFIGGGMAFTFIKRVHGVSIGNSIFDPVGFGLLDNILKAAKDNAVELVLPCDYVICDNPKNPTNVRNCQGDIPNGWSGMDIAPQSVLALKSIVDQVPKGGTVLWNGPMGVFEVKAFSAGTQGLAVYLAAATARGVQTIVGGGDSAAAAAQFAPHSVDQDFYHVSTGGGATLELLEGRELPGIAVLSPSSPS